MKGKISFFKLIPCFRVLCIGLVISPTTESRTDCELNFSSLPLLFPEAQGHVNIDGLTVRTSSDGL
jgi:hypothetical protein